MCADAATWAGTNDNLTEPSQNFICWPKGKQAGQTAGLSSTPPPAHSLPLDPGRLSSSLSSHAGGSWAGGTHNAWGYPGLISSGHAVQAGKGFQSQPSPVSVRSCSLCHGGGLDHAVLLTRRPVKLGCGESRTTGLSCCTPKTLPASLLCARKAACPRAMQLFLPRLYTAELVSPRKGAAIRTCSRGLGWLRHPLLGITAPHPREAFQSSGLPENACSEPYRQPEKFHSKGHQCQPQWGN